jgi:tungstate transport system substrate-binding protein
MRKKGLTVLSVLGACILAATIVQTAEAILLATTSSTDDTGLLAFLAPTILEATGVEMCWTSTGTGKALELGKNCDTDLVLVHAPKVEQVFMEQGYGVNCRLVMFNDLVLIGPKDNLAKVKGFSVAVALANLAKKQVVFVSRGDKSGYAPDGAGPVEGCRPARTGQAGLVRGGGPGYAAPHDHRRGEEWLHPGRPGHLLQVRE